MKLQELFGNSEGFIDPKKDEKNVPVCVGFSLRLMLLDPMGIVSVLEFISIFS